MSLPRLFSTTLPVIKLTCLFCGDENVGKTSLIQRIVGQEFSLQPIPTIGIDYHRLHVTINDQSYFMSCWDISGSPRFKMLVSSYFKLAQVVIIVLDPQKSIPNQISRWTSIISSNCDISQVKIFQVISKKDILDPLILASIPTTVTWIGSAVTSDSDSIMSLTKTIIQSVVKTPDTMYPDNNLEHFSDAYTVCCMACRLV